MRFKHSPQASGRDADMFDLRADIFDPRPDLGQIAGYIDRHHVRLTAGRVVQIDLT